MNAGIVLFSKVNVLPCNVVWNKVYDDFQALLVSSFNKFKEFLHSVCRIVCKIRIYVVVIYNGVRASGISFHHLFSSRCSVADNSGVPDIMGTEPLDVFKGPGVN